MVVMTVSTNLFFIDEALTDDSFLGAYSQTLQCISCVGKMQLTYIPCIIKGKVNR